MQKPKKKEESKEEVLGSETITSMKVKGRDHEVLLWLLDSGSSKPLVKKSSMQGAKDAQMSKSKPMKLKTQGEMFRKFFWGTSVLGSPNTQCFEELGELLLFPK